MVQLHLSLMVLRLTSCIPAFYFTFYLDYARLVLVLPPLAIATNFYGIDYSELQVHVSKLHTETVPAQHNTRHKANVRQADGS